MHSLWSGLRHDIPLSVPLVACRRSGTLDSSAAEHLWDKARQLDGGEDEELGARRSRAAALVRAASPQDPPWEGEETTQAAVTRMLADKYKPLRIQGWEKKIQQPSQSAKSPSSDSNPHINPAHAQSGIVEGACEPWRIIVKPPSFANGQACIRHGTFRPVSAKPSLPKDTRLEKAKEMVFSYREGDGSEVRSESRGVSSERVRNDRREGQYAATALAVGARRLESLIDNRVQAAEAQGLFRNLKNRGKPIPRDRQESNPYLSREELLLNRMVQRQGGAPPFVEVSGELQRAISAFRSSLRDDWVRRAVRMLSVTRITPSVVQSAPSYRDAEWQSQQARYHSAAVKQINSLVQKHNVMAPFSARKSLILVERELAAAFQEAGPNIQRELQLRMDRVAPMERATRYESTTGEGNSSGLLNLVRETLASAWSLAVGKFSSTSRTI